jgi:dTDP-4-amino-4,6-dideoxygalactose transaminase
MKVPFLDLKGQHKLIKDEILTLWGDILTSASFIGGEHVAALEQEFAEMCQSKYCIAVNSGTDALRFIFLALGLEKGDEVITVPNTFMATTEAISQAGGKFVFVDIDPDTCLMDPEKIESAITDKTKGIVPVHLYGQMADMDAIFDVAKMNGLWVVEDACQAHLAEYKGHKAGSMGIASAFSFYPGKNLGACGDGGAVTTNNEEMEQKIRMLRDHGQSKKYYHAIEGYNGRCDAIQAAALRVKIKHLPKWNEARRMIARNYLNQLKDADKVKLPKIEDDRLHVYHLFVVQVDNRNTVVKALAEKGIDTGLHYPIPLHQQDAYKELRRPTDFYPITESCAQKILSLPMFPELSDTQISYVCNELKKIVE